MYFSSSMDAFCLAGIINNFNHYGIADWVVVILLTIAPYIIMYFIKKRKEKKSQERDDTNIMQNNTVVPSVPENNSSTEHYNFQDNIRVDCIKPDSKASYLTQTGLDESRKYEEESSNIKFHRTELEEELSFQFEIQHSREIEKHTNTFITYRNMAATEKDLGIKIKLLQKAIDEFEKSKKFFYKTKGGTIFFQDRYEHLHNSQNPDFSYADLIKDALNYYIDLKENVIPAILNAISTNNGILQKDIYQYVPDFSQSSTRKVIKELEDSGKIIRTKKGSSYFLTLS